MTRFANVSSPAWRCSTVSAAVYDAVVNFEIGSAMAQLSVWMGASVVAAGMSAALIAGATPIAEMTRPSVKMGAEGPRWGGHCVYSLRFAGLARSFQARFLIHQCTSRYCLLNRNSCRFFFPWPKQPHQLHDENTDRIALQRRLESDDQWLSPSPIPHTMHIVTIVVVILLGKLNC